MAANQQWGNQPMISQYKHISQTQRENSPYTTNPKIVRRKTFDGYRKSPRRSKVPMPSRFDLLRASSECKPSSRNCNFRQRNPDLYTQISQYVDQIGDAKKKDWALGWKRWKQIEDSSDSEHPTWDQVMQSSKQPQDKYQLPRNLKYINCLTGLRCRTRQDIQGYNGRL